MNDEYWIGACEQNTIGHFLRRKRLSSSYPPSAGKQDRKDGMV